MGQNNYFKFFTLLAFVAFAAISCWATAESLHLLQPDLSLVICWVVSVGFFIIASLGTKFIVDSLNQNIYIEKRGALLFGGIILVILFWLITVMPTNTHTFFYRNVINETVNKDITTTQNYLSQIKSNTTFKESIKNKIESIENSFNGKLQDLKNELNNPLNPGNGEEVKRILKIFADMLDQKSIEPLSQSGSSSQDRAKIFEAYRSKLVDMKDDYINRLNDKFQQQDTLYKQREEAAEKAYNEIAILQEQIKAGKINLNDAKEIKDVSSKINMGYAVIQAYAEAVNFQPKEDRKLYTDKNPVSKVKRLTSVFDVWKDFIKGDYANSGFLFWVIIAILVDIAAFIFFDITFKKEA